MISAKASRLAILASHPIQYFTPIYRRLAAHPQLDVEVFFCRDFGVRARYDEQFGRTIRWDTDQLSGYSHRFLRNVSPISNPHNPLHAINPGAFSALFRGFDAVWLNGYLYPSNWFAAAAAGLKHTRIMLRSDSRLDAQRRRRWFDGIRDRVIRGWISRSDALLYIGTANREAYVAYGATAEKLFFTPFSVDVATLDSTARLNRHNKAPLRDKWRIPTDAFVVLFVGKLTGRKHPEALLSLFKAGRTLPNLHVVYAGSGPLEADLRREALAQGSSCTFLGFVNQRQLPEVYALADVFVMPSEREPWGLVLNEAMAAALPPVVSDAVGAVPDLISPAETGYLFRAGDWAQMTASVAKLAADDQLRRRMGEAARRRALLFSYEATTDGILKALVALGLCQPSPACS